MSGKKKRAKKKERKITCDGNHGGNNEKRYTREKPRYSRKVDVSSCTRYELSSKEAFFAKVL